MIEDKIRLFSELQDEYEKLLETTTDEEKSSIRSEISVIKLIISDLQWGKMPDEEKQARRKGTLSLADKWASHDGVRTQFAYEQAVVEFYDLVDSLLQKIRWMQKPDELKRLQAMLLAEQQFINSNRKFNLVFHNDYYVFTRLLQSLAKGDRYKELHLSHTHDKFREMYLLWKDRPYKEIL